METERLYYLGVVAEVVEDTDKGITKEYGIIKADIPGVIQGITAFPKRNELDEPKKGDAILLLCLDPILNSYWIYEKLKENDFIGIRSAGKMIDITPEKISIGIFDKSEEYKDDVRPDLKSYIEIDEDGNIEISTSDGSGDLVININGDTSIHTTGDTQVISDGSCVIKSPDVTITGDGTLTVKGNVKSTPGTGPFCSLPVCVYSGTTHQGKQVSGT